MLIIVSSLFYLYPVNSGTPVNIHTPLPLHSYVTTETPSFTITQPSARNHSSTSASGSITKSCVPPCPAPSFPLPFPSLRYRTSTYLHRPALSPTRITPTYQPSNPGSQIFRPEASRYVPYEGHARCVGGVSGWVVSVGERWGAVVYVLVRV